MYEKAQMNKNICINMIISFYMLFLSVDILFS